MKFYLDYNRRMCQKKIKVYAAKVHQNPSRKFTRNVLCLQEDDEEETLVRAYQDDQGRRNGKNRDPRDRGFGEESSRGDADGRGGRRDRRRGKGEDAGRSSGAEDEMWIKSLGPLSSCIFWMAVLSVVEGLCDCGTYTYVCMEFEHTVVKQKRTHKL